MKIIDRVDQLLKDRGITAKELAGSIGVSTGNISDWRSGKAKPSSEAVAKIAVYFGVTTDYLHGLTDARYSADIAAASSETGYDLPPEALEELEKYKELLRLKYGKKK